MATKWCKGKGSCLKGGFTQIPVTKNYYKSSILDQFVRQFRPEDCWSLPSNSGCWLLPNGEPWLVP